MISSSATRLFLQAKKTLDSVDDEISIGVSLRVQSYLAKYLTVYLSGIYEESIEQIIKEYSTRSGHSEIENYIAKQVDRSFRNPDMSAIYDLIGKFNTQWSTELKGLDDQYKDAINSIVANKNLIAHGNSSTLTIRDVKDFHFRATVVIEKIDHLFLGS
jgi:hypothetical protein